MSSTPTRLGEKLEAHKPQRVRISWRLWLRNAPWLVLAYALPIAIPALALWWFLSPQGPELNVLLILLSAMGVLWVYARHRCRALRPGKRPSRFNAHSLLANDQQGFMKDLRLDARTAIIDGSNIYHFGHNSGLDAQPLGRVANQLRSEGFRVVCFFDANIYYTLQKHGAFAKDERHAPRLLEDIFGLRRDEIYVVPSGVQADEYVLESLKHLPISFAVTNDHFRDYAKKYPTVMKDNQWRKGVAITKNEVRLLQHRQKTRSR